MLALLYRPRKKIAEPPLKGPPPARASSGRAPAAGCPARLIPAFFAALLFFLAAPAWADLLMQSNGKSMSLDRRGQLESPESDRSFSTPPRPQANATDTGLERLPYGIVPEVYVPWYPQWQGQRPHPPGGRPPGQGGHAPRPGGKPSSTEALPGASPPNDAQRPPAQKPGQRPGADKPGQHPGSPQGHNPAQHSGPGAQPGQSLP